MTTAPLNAQLTEQEIADFMTSNAIPLRFSQNAFRRAMGELAKSALSAGAPVAVGGRFVEGTLDNFAVRANVLLADEQAKLSPDNALVAFLCDAIRLTREYTGLFQNVLSHPVPAAPQAPLRNVLAELYEHTKWRDVPIAVLEAARLALELVPETTLAEVRCMPFDNCQYRYCDLPGQCVMEGKCHHPRPASSAAPQAVGERDAVSAQVRVVSLMTAHNCVKAAYSAGINKSGDYDCIRKCTDASFYIDKKVAEQGARGAGGDAHMLVPSASTRDDHPCSAAPVVAPPDLKCPPEYQTATGFYECSTVEGDDCAGCGCPKANHAAASPAAGNQEGRTEWVIDERGDVAERINEMGDTEAVGARAILNHIAKLEAALRSAAGNQDTVAQEGVCGCLRCTKERTLVVDFMFPIETTRMFCCSICGNKRCPHSDDHRNACTGSNDVGQPGSRYT